MIEQNGLSVLKKEKYSLSLSQFQNFDDALNELTRKLYDREYYNIPNSFVSVLYNLELHRFQTIAASSFHDSGVYTRTDNRNRKSTITIVRVKTNQKEFDDYIESVINKHTYMLEDLTKDEYRRLIIDYIVHLQMEKILLNPLQIAANHEIQTDDVRRLIRIFRNSDAKAGTDYENDKAQDLSTTITKVEIKTNQNEGIYHMQPLKNTSLTSK
jgi:hypothetical protein